MANLSARPRVSANTAGEITHLLDAWQRGRPAALDELIARLYRDLRRLAQSYVGRERGTPTLEATALVHEAFLRLEGVRDIAWRDRQHFFAVAAKVMRRILVESARRRAMMRRNGRVDYDPDLAGGLAARGAGFDPGVAELLMVDAAVERLARELPELARVVELRFFLGLEHAEAAAVLEVSTRTVKRRWQRARQWLHRQLEEQPSNALCRVAEAEGALGTER